MLGLLFPAIEYHVNVLVEVQCTSPKWHKSTKSVVFNICGVSFCGFFILRELIFTDGGQSSKSAKIRTKICQRM